MTQNYIHYSINIAKKSSEEIIMATTKGIKKKLLLSIISKLTHNINIDIKEVRRNISNKLQKEGRYFFSI